MAESTGDINSVEKISFDAVEIQKLIPHRYPFLLVDKIVECERGKRIVGIKNVTMNEEFFQGHFPGRPVMPGVLILEAMAQTAAILAKLSDEVSVNKTFFLVGVNEVKWKKQVVPGDTLRIEVSPIKHRRPLWIMQCVVTVEGKVVAQAQISAMEAE